jgi:hypothetical protein
MIICTEKVTIVLLNRHSYENISFEDVFPPSIAPLSRRKNTYALLMFLQSSWNVKKIGHCKLHF